MATTTLLSPFVYLIVLVRIVRRGGREIVRRVDCTLQEHADGHLGDGLDAAFLVTVDLVYADVVLAIAGCCYRRHCDW